MIEIRPATVGDAPALAELRWEFRSNRPATTEDRDAFVARCTTWMQNELATGGRWHVWVAGDEGRLVGQIWLQLVSKLPNPAADEEEQLAYISNVYVVPSARGGVGVRLLETALAFVDAAGVDRVVLWPSTRSVTLYERHGFRRAGDVMELTCRASRQ